MNMSKAKKAKLVGGNPLIQRMVTAKMEGGAMKRPERPKADLPDWAKNPEKYQYQKGLGGNQTMKLMRKKKKVTGVKRPQEWNADDVLINKIK